MIFSKTSQLATAAALVASLGAPAPAQPVTWWDIFSPDRMVETLTRYAIVLARSQVDLTFGDISTNLLSNRTRISDLTVWPITPWASDENCRISVARITIRGPVLDNYDNAAFKIDAYDTTIGRGCVAPEAREIANRLDLDGLTLPFISIEADYHIPSSEAVVDVAASVAGFGEASLHAGFDYVSMRGPNYYLRDPEVFALLREASLEVHNLGGWDAVRGFLPPALTDPETAGQAVEPMLRSILVEMNRNSRDGASEDLNVLQLAFLSAARDTWTGFLTNPTNIVLETNIAEDRPVYLNVFQYERNPASIFFDLNPAIRTGPSAQLGKIDDAALDALAAGTWRDLPPDRRIALGKALATGQGIPENRALASEILAVAAEGGNAEAAAILGEMLENRDPETAYLWSLHASAAGQDGAASRLDRLEGILPLAAVLRLQDAAIGERALPQDAPQTAIGIRTAARAHLSGIGAYRNYEAAYTWASLGQALGDTASAAIGAEVSALLDGASGENAQAAASALRDRASDTAFDLWAELSDTVQANARPVAAPADAAAEATDGSSIDGDMEACLQLFETTMTGGYEVGGSCLANNHVLLRELALAGRMQDTLRMQLYGPDTAEPWTMIEPLRADSIGAVAVGLQDELNAAIAENQALRAEANQRIEDLERELALSNTARTEVERKAEMVNQQVAALREQLGSLQALLDSTAEHDAAARAQIEALGSQLNMALARAAAEERRRREMEVEARERLEAEIARVAAEAARPPSKEAVLDEVRARYLASLAEVLSANDSIRAVDNRLVFSSGDLFQRGSTQLSASGRRQISAVATKLMELTPAIPQDVDWIVRVEGHTDDIPITSGTYADNWELSQARALSVVRFLAGEIGFASDRLAAVGFGEFRPVNPENSAAARAQNRRIELALDLR